MRGTYFESNSSMQAAEAGDILGVATANLNNVRNFASFSIYTLVNKSFVQIPIYEGLGFTVLDQSTVPSPWGGFPIVVFSNEP